MAEVSCIADIPCKSCCRGCSTAQGTHIMMNHNNENVCQPGLGACGASLSSPSRLVLSDCTGAECRQTIMSDKTTGIMKLPSTQCSVPQDIASGNCRRVSSGEPHIPQWGGAIPNSLAQQLIMSSSNTGSLHNSSCMRFAEDRWSIYQAGPDVLGSIHSICRL